MLAVIPVANPVSWAVSERTARLRRRSTVATQIPATGPKSGPTIIAPTIRMALPRRMPAMAMSMARIIRSRKLADRAVIPATRLSTSSQTTASEALALFSTAVVPPEICVLTGSRAIDPPSRICRSRRSATRALASSAATSHKMRSPDGRRTAPGMWIRLTTEEVASSRRRAASALPATTTRRNWITSRPPSGSPRWPGALLCLAANLRVGGTPLMHRRPRPDAPGPRQFVHAAAERPSAGSHASC